MSLLREQSPSVVEEAGVWPNAWQPVGGDASWTATMNEWGHGCCLGHFSTRVKTTSICCRPVTVWLRQQCREQFAGV